MNTRCRCCGSLSDVESVAALLFAGLLGAVAGWWWKR